MCCGDDSLALLVGLFDDLLLVDRNEGCFNFNAQIASCDHDAVGNFKDLVEVVETFLVFDLGDDLNFRLAHFRNDLADLQDIFRSSDEGCCDEIDIVVAAEADIFIILH